ncbi:hypothetical protein [Flavobacterium sp.]|uniref:hypothetical protein n=1 Tax=Flavobacterium sp. TaxID=239 RepID=UPI00375231F7
MDYALVDKAQQQIDELKKQGIDVDKIDSPEIKSAKEALEGIPAKWRVDYAGILGMIVSIIAFIMVVLAFMKKDLVKKISVVVIVLSAILWFIAPDIEAGMTSGANPKSIALISFIALAIASACAYMSYTLYLKKSTTV